MMIQRLCYLCFFSVWLMACSDEQNKDLVAYIHEVIQRPVRQTESLPSFARLPTFEVPVDSNRRSPFKPVGTQKTRQRSEAEQDRPRQALEAYPLDALKFVGKQASLNIYNKQWD